MINKRDFLKIINLYRDVYSSSPEDENDLNNLNEEAEDVFIQIDISEAHKVGEGISSFMAYKVDTRTNMKLFRRQSFSVTRRFSDFLGKSWKSRTKILIKSHYKFFFLTFIIHQNWEVIWQVVHILLMFHWPCISTIPMRFQIDFGTIVSLYPSYKDLFVWCISRLYI